jgi:DNA-binding transcriptional LysR family regulator
VKPPLPLDRASIPWHIAFTSPSLHGLWAAVDAGLGITVRTASGLPGQLVVLDKKFGLPPLATTELSLHDAGRELTPAAARFKEILFETLAANLPVARKVKRNFA